MIAQYIALAATLLLGVWFIYWQLWSPPYYHPTGWISVDEMMPPPETPVLIIIDGEIRIGERRISTPGWEETYDAYFYWDNPYDDGQAWDNSYVTHWSYLPLLPKPTT
jgi:hypothetical protein